MASAAGQFDDARYNITLVQSFIMAAGNTVNDARVTDFRCEATGQISDVVARETAKQMPSGESQVKTLLPRGNEKFIARRSHAMSATQSGCIAFNSLHLSRFAKGDYVNRPLLADSGMAGVSSGRLAVVMSTPTIQPKTSTVLLSQG